MTQEQVWKESSEHPKMPCKLNHQDGSYKLKRANGLWLNSEKCGTRDLHFLVTNLFTKILWDRHSCEKLLCQNRHPSNWFKPSMPIIGFVSPKLGGIPLSSFQSFRPMSVCFCLYRATSSHKISPHFPTFWWPFFEKTRHGTDKIPIPRFAPSSGKIPPSEILVRCLPALVAGNDICLFGNLWKMIDKNGSMEIRGWICFLWL